LTLLVVLTTLTLPCERDSKRVDWTKIITVSYVQILMRVPQLKLQLMLKDNEVGREAKMLQELKKETEKQQQQAGELRAQVEVMKHTIAVLQRDNKELQDVISDQKVSRRPLETPDCILSVCFGFASNTQTDFSYEFY